MNYATKCAQSADRHEIVITGSVWDAIEGNDYLAYTCGCTNSPSPNLWSDRTINRLTDDEQYGRVTGAPWCVNCGPSFCAAIMAGQRKRTDIPNSARLELSKSQMVESIAKRAQIHRKQREAHWQGMRTR